MQMFHLVVTELTNQPWVVNSTGRWRLWQKLLSWLVIIHKTKIIFTINVNRQEGISIGYVPPASVAVSTGWGSGGVCLWVRERSASGSRFLPLGQGGTCGSRRCLSVGPRGVCLWVQEVSVCGSKGSASGSGGGCLPLGPGGDCLWVQGVCL